MVQQLREAELQQGLVDGMDVKKNSKRRVFLTEEHTQSQ